MSNHQPPVRARPGVLRRRYLINRPFQFAFIARMVGIAVGIIAVFYGANAFFFWNLRKEAAAQNVPLDHIFFRYLDYHEQRLTALMAVLAVVVVLGLTLFGLLYSHRIAGPLYRLTMHLTGIAEGRRGPTPVRFRQGDYFQEIATAYNKHLGALKDFERPVDKP